MLEVLANLRLEIMVMLRCLNTGSGISSFMLTRHSSPEQLLSGNHGN